MLLAEYCSAPPLKVMVPLVPRAPALPRARTPPSRVQLMLWSGVPVSVHVLAPVLEARSKPWYCAEGPTFDMSKTAVLVPPRTS